MDKAARAKPLAERVIELSRADQTEVFVASTTISALTRFTHDIIHQNVALPTVA